MVVPVLTSYSRCARERWDWRTGDTIGGRTVPATAELALVSYNTSGNLQPFLYHLSRSLVRITTSFTLGTVGLILFKALCKRWLSAAILSSSCKWILSWMAGKILLQKVLHFALTISQHAPVLILNLFWWTLWGFSDFCKLTQYLWSDE